MEISDLVEQDYRKAFKEFPFWKDFSVLSESLKPVKENSETRRTNLNEFDDIESYIEFLEETQEEESPEEELQISPLDINFKSKSDQTTKGLVIKETYFEEMYEMDFDLSFNVYLLNLSLSGVNSIKVSSFWEVTLSNYKLLGYNTLPFTYNQTVILSSKENSINTQSVYKSTNKLKKRESILLKDLSSGTYEITLLLEKEGEVKASDSSTITLPKRNQYKVIDYE